jgi:arylsulfatase
LLTDAKKQKTRLSLKRKGGGKNKIYVQVWETFSVLFSVIKSVKGGKRMTMTKKVWMLLMVIAFAIALYPTGPAEAAKKPNILVIWGDDVGRSNISAYTMGMMGYQTPNIDRIANEGIIFTDYYGEQSCTAGRSSFIMGQSVFRTGLSKVGLPGAKEGMHEKDPTIAVLLKDQGYATGQFGKNHLGDRDEHLPTNHGFDEFFGNLYHLNAEEEPENEDYPKNPEFRKRFGPRGVIKSAADGKIEDTGPLTKKRMETVDDETVAAAIDFIERQTKAKKPWFIW